MNTLNPIIISVKPDISLAALKLTIDLTAFNLCPMKKEPAVTKKTKEIMEVFKSIE